MNQGKLEDCILGTKLFIITHRDYTELSWLYRVPPPPPPKKRRKKKKEQSIFSTLLSSTVIFFHIAG